MMNRRGLGIGLVAAMAIGGATIAAPRGARAQQAPDAARAQNAAETKYAEAFASISSKFEAAMLAKGPAPRRDDPEVAAALDRLSDVGRLYGGPDFPARMEFAACAIADRVTQAYLLHDLQRRMQEQGVASPDKVTPQAIAKLQDDNLIAFRDEATPLIAFGPRCLAQLVPVVTRFAQSLPREQMTPARVEGLNRVRIGARDMMFGAASSAADERLTQTQRALVLDNVVAAAPVLVGTMPPKQRIETASALLTLRNAAPEWARPGLQALIAALEQPGCDGLCALGGPAK